MLGLKVTMYTLYVMVHDQFYAETVQLHIIEGTTCSR